MYIKFSSVEGLNLNIHEIVEERPNHLSNVLFNKLNNFYLFNNNISSEGVKYLFKTI